MKFSKGQKVEVIPLSKGGVIISGFVVKEYAKPDVYHYNVLVSVIGLIEANEDELRSI